MSQFLKRSLLVIVLFSSACTMLQATDTAPAKPKPTSSTIAKKTSAKKPFTQKKHYYERFYTSSIDLSNTSGDVVTGEDPALRAAAVDALGNYNGTVVVSDPDSGRILAMVNQKLALSEGAQPCSTIKVAVALAGLSEGVINDNFGIRLTRYRKIDLTYALAHSNNLYFEEVGRRLGFDKVSFYAHQFGLGELAGYNIEGEHLGEFPTQELDTKLGGVGKMCSFGESISMTPLQLAAMMGAVANGGTLFYLQHPQTTTEITSFEPKIKRTLEIQPYISEMEPGMEGAVDFGTARRLRTSFSDDVMGKTGTCSKDGTRFGWFASIAHTSAGRIVTVVFLRGDRNVFGPKAAEIAGKFFKNIDDKNVLSVSHVSTFGNVQ